MSTRSNIFIDCNGDRLQFYHHCDGYLEGVGIELLSMLKLAYSLTPVKERLGENGAEAVEWEFLKLMALNDRYELEEIGLHRDIEYLYYVHFENGNINISYTKVKPFCKSEILEKLEKAEKGEKIISLEIKAE